MIYTCPCCGIKTIDEPFSYEICEICGWEDDPIQLDYPALKGGANKGSLYEEQVEILKMIPETITDINGIQRDDEWRALHVIIHGMIIYQFQKQRKFQISSDYYKGVFN